ncbi:MAG: hypothetical protein ABI614_07850, partial [Planctomycetota bacterium]
LILWYLPGEWKRDPFRVGVIVAEYVPQIVPAKFRGNKAKEDSDSQSAAQGSGSGIPDFNFNGFGGGGADSGKSANTNNAKANNSKKKENKNNTANLSVEPLDEEQMSLEDSAAAGADLFGTPLEVPGLELGGLPLLDAPVSPLELPSTITKTTEEPTPELPLEDDVPSTSEAPKPEVAPLTPGSIRNAPQVSSDNVAESVQAALSGNRAWDDDEATSLSGAIKKDFYFAFSKLGEALAFADRTDETVATQIAETDKLLKEVSQRADKLAVIGGVAKGWIAAGRESRKTNGVCLYGVVKAVEPIGELFETTIESAGQQIAVVSTSDPAEYFALDSQVLVLGSILDDPAKNLGGYEGSRAVVVVDGYHINVPTE